MFSLICVWINGWANNREAGDLIRYRAHYDVTVMYYNQWSFILIVKRDSCIFIQIRASFLSFGHPGLSKLWSFGHPRVEIRASLDKISPPRLARCRRLPQKFLGLDKDTHQITKLCKYQPLKTCSNDGITFGKFLPSEASAMLGCPKLQFRAPVGALWINRLQWKNIEIYQFSLFRVNQTICRHSYTGMALHKKNKTL